MCATSGSTQDAVRWRQMHLCSPVGACMTSAGEAVSCNTTGYQGVWPWTIHCIDARRRQGKF